MDLDITSLVDNKEIENLNKSFFNPLEEMSKTQRKIVGDISGVNDIDFIKKIQTKIDNIIKTMDGLDPDQGSGQKRQQYKRENGQIEESKEFCKQCGKEISRKKKGFCSQKCKKEFQKTNVDSGKIEDDSFQKQTDNNKNAISGCMSSINELSQILSDINSRGLDPRLKDYLKLKIATAKTLVSQKMLVSNISKNNKLINETQKLKSGFETKSSKQIQSLEKSMKQLEKLKSVLEKFNVAYDKLYNSMTMLTPLSLQEESLHFLMTPRSFIKAPGKIVNPLPNNNMNDSMMDTLHIEKIRTVIEKTFPDLKSEDFVLPPDVFKVKKFLSSKNTNAILKIVNVLQMLLKGPTEPLPVYKDLKLTNIQFLLYLLTSWGPTGLKHYGLPVYP